MKGFSQAVGRWGPIFLSSAAILLLFAALATNWERGLKDEGVVAHLWQILIVLQFPLVALFLATADWRRPGDVAKRVALQVVALALAMAPVAMFRL